MFALNGLSSLSEGLGVHVSTFQTAAPSYVWLNDVIAIGEGTVRRTPTWPCGTTKAGSRRRFLTSGADSSVERLSRLRLRRRQTEWVSAQASTQSTRSAGSGS